jgi:hypothetical protein
MKKLLKTFALILFLNLAFCDLTIAIVDHYTFIISYIITVFVERCYFDLIKILKTCKYIYLKPLSYTIKLSLYSLKNVRI